MSELYTNRNHLRGNESGVIIVFVAASIIAFLLVLGLALDSANLFRARLELQGAVDAAAIGGVSYIAADVVSPTSANEGEQIARRVLLENLRGSTVTLKTGSPTVQFTDDPVSGRAWMEVRADADVDLWLISAVPGIGHIRTVAARAEADLLPAHVTLMLDTSDSMRCSADESDRPFCGCTDSGATCDPDIAKLKFLKDASKTFLTYFDPDRDRISLIAYNTGARTLVNFKPQGHRPVSDLTNAIDALGSVGYTNPCEAMLFAYLNAEAIGELDSMSYVLFSDGPPTAARFWFDYSTSTPRTHGSLPPNQVMTRVVGGKLLSRFDYFNWAYRHEQPSQYTVVPSRLVPTSGPRISWTPYNYPGPGQPAGCPLRNGDSGDRCPSCSYLDGYYDRPAFSWLCFRSTRRAEDGLAPFFTPDGQRWRGDLPIDVVPDPDTPGGNPYRWWKMYYDCAVAHSDAIRQQGGLLFNIGLGQPALSAAAGDPYQDVSDVFNRKDVLLRRMAFDICGITDPDFPEVDTYGELAAAGNTHGMSLTTTDARDLDLLFRAVAVKIKTRLVR